MKLAKEIKTMIKESNEVISIYLLFGMKGKADLENNHVTLMYFGDKSLEDKAKIEKILEDYFANNEVKEFTGTFDKEEMFGPEKDVRVLTTSDNSKFLLDLRKELEPFNGSQFKDYNPHYTTDLPSPQEVVFDKVTLSTTGYKPIKTYEFGKMEEAKRIGKNSIAVTKEEKAVATELVLKLMDRGFVNIDSELKHKVAMDLVAGGQAVITKKKEYGKIAQIRGVD